MIGKLERWDLRYPAELPLREPSMRANARVNYSWIRAVRAETG